MSYKLLAGYWLSALMIGFELLFITRFAILSSQHLGEYSQLTRTYWCTSHTSCIHEQGHALDQSLGFPSQSPAYRNVLVVLSAGTDTWSQVIAWELSTKHPLAETYAEMYQAVNGNIDRLPVELQLFYE